MKTAGLIYDFYDDPTGDLLKEAFPTPESLPDIIKEAHILNENERGVLRNEAYALVMNNEGKLLRKFACVDAGNTALSVLYYIKNLDTLTEEAQKVAASNLITHCEEFDIPVPVLLKFAAKGGLTRTRDSMLQPVVGDEADWAQRTNLVSVRSGSDSGRVAQTAAGLKTASIVDVTGVEKLTRFEKKASSRFALGTSYPLDSYADVQKAVQYFEESFPDMGPEDRHEYCVKTASRAEELGISVPELMSRYGSSDYSLDIDAHLANRRAVSPENASIYVDLQEKIASVDPETFAKLLTDADEKTNLNWFWGGEIADPYYATFGGYPEKDKQAAWSWMGRTGDYTTAEELNELAVNGRGVLKKHFQKEIIDAFQKDPIAIFESLPDQHKILISRMAADMKDPYSTN